ncbi:MAG: DUF1027 domain-containing protein [Streptococcaceae bacterium]|nr:DUF1027 domain-containing protein [Streptococcaceae bacterium]MCL2681054.1 DUF1027 domain-containing protein [Streptococcaceae bacterium]
MPREIDESKLNYNKFPGEKVDASGNLIKIGHRVFHLVHDYREAFDAEKLEQRFSDLFDKYDYIVGDLGYEQLRLKGFFSADRKKMSGENKIDHVQDYVNEYCNFGCAYFILKRVRSKEEKVIQAHTSERKVREGKKPSKFRPKKANSSSNKKKNDNENQSKFVIRQRSEK